ncbi:MAG: 1-acyl-sn-glycerol-3-phosphate acyltransferase [Polyangiaceae bacterium]|nr:1-acyl-sn-glycerol-3-phosphate acyltransferase [Polyangiaceae bacterium]
MLLPSSVLNRIYHPLLRRIPLDPAWVDTVREAASKGSVIHIVRNVSLLDLLALSHFSNRAQLPPITFANDFADALGASPVGLFKSKKSPEEALRETVLSGKSAVLFLKRAPGVLERASTAHRGKTEGDALLSCLIDLAEHAEKNILLVPQTLVWTMRPERRGFWARDFLFSPAEFPGEVRSLLQLGVNLEHVVVRAGEPLNLREFLTNDRAGDPHILRRLVYALLRKAERERKSVVGPAQKPPDRVREEVLKTPRLASVLRDMAAGDEVKLREAVENARTMLQSLQAEPDPSTLRTLEVMADTLAERVFSGIDVDEAGIAEVRQAARKGSVVLLPSHKSHIDYLLLHYVLRKHALNLPLVAAGDNLSFFPLGPILRRSGAFFIRRSFRGDKLYAVVVDAYIRRLLRDGHAVEFFLEGGRSRTGKLLPPQVGLLNMVVEAALGLGDKPVAFVPVSIGYERIMEETEFLRELSGEAKKGEDLTSLVSAGRALLQSYGRPNVQFGKVVDLTEFRRSLHIADDPTPAKRRALVNALASHVMDEINRVAAVTPGALVATVLLCHPRRGMPHADLVERAARLLDLVQAMGARTTPKLTYPSTHELVETSLIEACDVYVRGGLVRRHIPGDTLTGVREKKTTFSPEKDVIWVVPDERRIALDISKNMIVHLFVDRAILAIALGTRPEGVSTRDGLKSSPQPFHSTQTATLERAQTLAKLFKTEFNLRDGPALTNRFEATLRAMRAAGEVAESSSGNLIPGEGHTGLDGRGWLLFYTAILKNFLEGYRIAARCLRTLVSVRTPRADLIQKALSIGEQMFLGGEIDRPEAVSRPLLDNALTSFRDLGYLERDTENLTLAAPYQSSEAAAAIESTIAAFLTRPSFDPGY